MRDFVEGIAEATASPTVRKILGPTYTSYNGDGLVQTNSDIDNEEKKKIMEMLQLRDFNM